MSENKRELTIQLELTNREFSALVSAASIGAMTLRGEKIPQLWVSIADRQLGDSFWWNHFMKRLEAAGRAAFPEAHHRTSGPRPR